MRVFRFWVYFRRAHNNYFAYVLSFINFITITYTLIFVRMLGFPESPTALMAYGVIFVVSYFVIATFIGWFDFRRGTVPVETTLIAMNNPYARDIAKAIYLLAEGRNEEAKEVLKKWFE